MSRRLLDRRILVTGAAGGIGSCIVEALLAEGAQVQMVDLNEPALEALAERNGQSYHAVNLLNSDDRTRLVNALEASAEPLDGLVNCAGINAFGLQGQMNESLIERMLQINLIMPMLLTQQLLPLLHRSGQAVIVNMGSVFGHIGFPGFAAYSASKFGLHGYTEALRRELHDTSVRVSYVAPRATRTPMNHGLIDQMNEELKVRYDAPQVVAAAVVQGFLSPGKDRVLGWPEKLFARLNQWFPGLVSQSLNKQLNTIRKYNQIQQEQMT